MDGGAANLDSHNRVESTNGSLKWLQKTVLVGKNTELSIVYTQTHTGVDVLLGGFEPSISLGLLQKIMSVPLFVHGQCSTYLLEDVVQQSIVCIVVHDSERWGETIADLRKGKGRTSVLATDSTEAPCKLGRRNENQDL